MTENNKTTVYKNKNAVFILECCIVALVLWNLYNVFITQKYMMLVPIVIQIALLYLIFTKHRFAATAIKIWVGIFFIGSSVLSLLGYILKLFSTTNASLTRIDILVNVFLLIIGVVIFFSIKSLLKLKNVSTKKGGCRAYNR